MASQRTACPASGRQGTVWLPCSYSSRACRLQLHHSAGWPQPAVTACDASSRFELLQAIAAVGAYQLATSPPGRSRTACSVLLLGLVGGCRMRSARWWLDCIFAKAWYVYLQHTHELDTPASACRSMATRAWPNCPGVCAGTADCTANGCVHFACS